MVETWDLLAEARTIVAATRYGKLSYDQAKAKVLPLLQSINRRGKEIAKKHKVRYKPITFTSLIR